MKKILLSLFAAALLFNPLSVFAQNDFGLQDTAKTAFGSNSNFVSQGRGVPELAGDIIGVVLSLVGLIFFILMIYAGILWMTARGNDSTTERAKETIIAAIIGIVIVLASYAITSFVFQSVENPQSVQAPAAAAPAAPAPAQ